MIPPTYPPILPSVVVVGNNRQSPPPPAGAPGAGGGDQAGTGSFRFFVRVSPMQGRDPHSSKPTTYQLYTSNTVIYQLHTRYLPLYT